MNSSHSDRRRRDIKPTHVTPRSAYRLQRLERIIQNQITTGLGPSFPSSTLDNQLTIPNVRKVIVHAVQVELKIADRDRFLSIQGKSVIAPRPAATAPNSRTLPISGGIKPGPIGRGEAQTTMKLTSQLKLAAQVTAACREEAPFRDQAVWRGNIGTYEILGSAYCGKAYNARA